MINSISGTLIEIGNPKQVNKSLIRQSFVLEISTEYSTEVIKMYCKNDMCHELIFLLGNPRVTVQFKLAGKMTKAGNINNDFEVIGIFRN